ncbi:hypothetical protein PSYJA_46346, partial [Pseudomonas syringae pv. japonica str. M301072]
ALNKDRESNAEHGEALSESEALAMEVAFFSFFFFF